MDSTRIHDLKNLLFEEEYQKFKQLDTGLVELHEKIENKKISGEEIEELVEHIQETMPEKLGPTITRTLKTQIRESRDDVVQALYPIIGQLIKKYIQQEIEKLRESIDQQLENTFSWEILVARAKSLVTGKPVSHYLIVGRREPQIEEIFVIEQHSGILIGSFSRTGLMDKDMVAGMLTAIKGFVKDAFQKENQELNTIQYDTFTLYIQDFGKFYISVAVSGVFGAEFKSKLDQTILDFVKKITAENLGEDFNRMNKRLNDYFKSIAKS